MTSSLQLLPANAKIPKSEDSNYGAKIEKATTRDDEPPSTILLVTRPKTHYFPLLTLLDPNG